ncbi:MAG: acyl-CoA thioesterase [Acidobacteria bacterium]|nr:acyl-CoA thioesterase [Acidobacteriota bacterium]
MPDSDLQPAIRVIMMPRDTNAYGTIFGGVILSYIDQAGAVEVKKYTKHRVVTVAMHEVVFVSPVLVGDLVSFYTTVLRVGRTSITIKVMVEATRGADPPTQVHVTEAEVVYVALDHRNLPTPITS